MKTKLICFLLLTIIVAIRSDEEDKEETSFKPKFHKKLMETKTFKKFIKMIDEHQMNVTVLLSKTDKFHNGNIQDIISLAITMPTNDVSLTGSKLTKQDGKQFMKLATDEKIPALMSDIHKNEVENKLFTNNPHGIVDSFGLELMRTLHSNGKVGYVFKEGDSFGALYTFIDRELDNKTTKVLYGDIKVDVVDKKGMSDAEIKKATDVLIASLFEFYDEDVPRAIVTAMDKFNPKFQWQASDKAEGFFDTEKYVHLKAVSLDYFIFATS